MARYRARGRSHPRHEDRAEDEAQQHDAADGGRSEHREGVAPGDLDAQFALPAHFVKAQSGEGADQGEARDHREEQRQHVIAERHPRHDDADNRVDDDKEEDVGAIGAEIAPGALENFAEIADLDLPHMWRRAGILMRPVGGLAQRLDRFGAVPDLVPAPFEGIADRCGHLIASSGMSSEGAVPRHGIDRLGAGHERTAAKGLDK